MEIVDRILQLAKENNITPNRLTVECKINCSAFTDWKKGKSKPSLDALIKIADYFNISLDNLIGRNASFNATIDTESDIPVDIVVSLKKMDNLEYAELRGIIRMIEKDRIKRQHITKIADTS